MWACDYVIFAGKDTIYERHEKNRNLIYPICRLISSYNCYIYIYICTPLCVCVDDHFVLPIHEWLGKIHILHMYIYIYTHTTSIEMYIYIYTYTFCVYTHRGGKMKSCWTIGILLFYLFGEVLEIYPKKYVIKFTETCHGWGWELKIGSLETGNILDHQHPSTI